MIISVLVVTKCQVHLLPSDTILRTISDLYLLNGTKYISIAAFLSNVTKCMNKTHLLPLYEGVNPHFSHKYVQEILFKLCLSVFMVIYKEISRIKKECVQEERFHAHIVFRNF